MVISIDSINISSKFLGKQTNNSDLRVQGSGGPLCRVAKLKINVAQGKFILEFAIML